MKKLLALVSCMVLYNVLLYPMDIQRLSMGDIYQFHKETIDTFFGDVQAEIKQLSPLIENLLDEATQEKAQALLNTLEHDVVTHRDLMTQQLEERYQKSKLLRGYHDKLVFHNQAQNIQEQVFNGLTAELNIIRNLINSDQRSREYEQYKRKIDQTLAAKRKVRTFFHIVQQALPLLNDIHVEMRNASRTYLTTKSREAAQNYKTSIKKYKEVARIIADGYKESGIRPDFNDKTNLARIAYTRFIQSCIDDISVTHNVMHRLFQDFLMHKATADTYVKQFFAMQERLFGDSPTARNDKGYSALARTITQTLFNQKAQEFQDQFWNEIYELYTIMAIHFLENCMRMHRSWNEGLSKTFNFIQMIYNQAKIKDISLLERVARACLTIIHSDIKRLLSEVTLQDMLEQLPSIIDICNQGIFLASQVGLDSQVRELKGIISTIEKLISDKKEANQLSGDEKVQRYQDIQRKLTPLGGQPTPISSKISTPPAQKTISYNIEDLKTEANRLMKEGSYADAVKKYEEIIKQVKKAGDTEKQKEIENKYLQALSKALVLEYMQNVLPNDQDTGGIEFEKIGVLSIPKSYKLVRFVQPIPTEIAQKYQNGSSQRLINLAFYIYVSNQLLVQGVDARAVLDEKGNVRKSFPDVSEEQKNMVQSILKNAGFFKNSLQNMVYKKNSVLSIEYKKDQIGELQPSLVITQFYVFPVVPVPNSPLTQLAYPGYPTAQSYFAWAQKFGDPTNKDIPYGIFKLPSADMPDKVKQLNRELGKAFLSATKHIDRRVNFIIENGNKKAMDETIGAKESETLQKARDAYQKIQALPSKQTAKLDTYIDTYRVVQSYINDAQITYYVAGEGFLKKADETSIKFDQLESDAYQKLGDIARTFLIGNPQDPLYLAGMRGVWSGVLADVMNYYKFSYGLVSSKRNDLLKEITQAASQAGQVLVDQQKLLASKRYYEIAVGSALSISPQDTKVLHQASVDLLFACYGGATQLLNSFRSAYTQPIVVEYQGGRKATFTFEKFVERIVTCPSPDVNKFECDVYEQQRTDLLDALVYLQEGFSWTSYLKNPQAVDHPHIGQTTDTQKTSVNSMLIDFKKQWNISFDSIDDTKQFLKSENFDKVMDKAFQEFRDMLKTDKNSDQAFDFFSQWNNQLFLAIINLYADWYMKSAGPLQQRFADVLQLIKLENVNILAPAEQWIG